MVTGCDGGSVGIKSFERSSGINLGITMGADSHTGESGGCGVVDVGFAGASFFAACSSIMSGTGTGAIVVSMISIDVGDDGVLLTVVLLLLIERLL